MQSIKLVTFDATNTLLKFRVPPWQYYAFVARDHGFQGTADDVKGRFKDSYKQMWDKYPNFGKESLNWEEWWKGVVKLTFNGQLPINSDVNQIATKLINAFKTSKCWCIAEGGDKVVKLLRDSGVAVGVISNFDPRLVDILKDVKLHNNFDFILTSYEIGFSKPDERIFQKALAICDQSVQPSESLHIGDDLVKDYEGARAAGWHALLINKELKTKVPDGKYVFSDLQDLNIALEQKKIILRND